MPRRSSGGRSAPRPVSARSPPPQTVNRAPPPAKSQASGGGGGSILGGIGSTIAQGMAWGTGSAIAHRGVDAVMGPRTIQYETVVSSEAVSASSSSSSPVRDNTMGSCDIQSKAFQDCVNNFGSDINKCQFYMNMLSECRKSSGSMIAS